MEEQFIKKFFISSMGVSFLKRRYLYNIKQKSPKYIYIYRGQGHLSLYKIASAIIDFFFLI